MIRIELISMLVLSVFGLLYKFWLAGMIDSTMYWELHPGHLIYLWVFPCILIGIMIIAVPVFLQLPKYYPKKAVMQARLALIVINIFAIAGIIYTIIREEIPWQILHPNHLFTQQIYYSVFSGTTGLIIFIILFLRRANAERASN